MSLWNHNNNIARTECCADYDFASSGCGYHFVSLNVESVIWRAGSQLLLLRPAVGSGETTFVYRCVRPAEPSLTPSCTVACRQGGARGLCALCVQKRTEGKLLLCINQINEPVQLMRSGPVSCSCSSSTALLLFFTDPFLFKASRQPLLSGRTAPQRPRLCGFRWHTQLQVFGSRRHL